MLLSLVAAVGCYAGRGDADSPFGSGADEGGDGESGGDDPVPVDCSEAAYGPRVLRLMTRSEYQNTVADLLDVDPPETDSIPVEPLIDGYDNNAAASFVTARHIDAYMRVANDVATTVVAERGAQLAGCSADDANCPRLFVESFGKRAFRRPLETEEVDLYVENFSAELTDGSFDEGMVLAIRALMISPNFLYRSELGEPIGDGVYRLTPYEVASALSYGFWGTMPDAELMADADSGALDSPEGIEAAAARLLEDPRGRARVGDFATQWLGTRLLTSTNKDAQVYPNFTDDIRVAMVQEQQRFIEEVVFGDDPTVAELLTADYVFVNDTLANFYGLAAPGSNELVQLPVDETANRGGLLRLGSVLASHAHPNESSPVKRGTFVRERIMCQPLSPPPPDIDATPPEIDPNATTRERFAAHSEDPACQGCHLLIDPLGFGFEGYDGVGAFRSEENGLPIDESGTVNALGDGRGPEDFNGPGELGAILASTDDTTQCLARQYYRFATGREELAQDECAIEEVSERLAESGGNIHQMLLDVVRVDAFTLRQDF